MADRRPVWKWMAAAFCAALALAIGAMSVALVIQHRLRIGPGLEVTARFPFLLFWPAYVGGALTRACGDHLLVWTSASLDDLHHLRRRGVLHVFACASAGPAHAGGSASQCLAAIPFVAMNYILFAFILDFSRFQTYCLIDVVKCLPFLALAICAPILRLAAWAKTALPSSPVRLSRKIGRSADFRSVRAKFQGRPPKRLKRAAPIRSFCISVVPST